MGSKILVPAFLAILIGGCPKRQTTPRVVYVQPPPAVSPSGGNTATQETLIIQEPAPSPAPEPPAPPAPAASAKQIQPDKHSVRPRQSHDAGEKPADEAAQPPAATEPPPQLASGSDQEEAQLATRLDEMDKELGDLERRTDLIDAQKRTIQDAGAFRAQSVDALHHRDLLRAKQLADKAGLLIKAVQGQP